MRKGFVAALFVFALVTLVALPASAEKTVFIKNTTAAPVKVYVAFGADSQVNKNNIGFPCTFFNTEPRGLNCGFDLSKGEQKQISQKGKILNMTVAFNKAPGCGVTLAEVNANRSGIGADATNISVVDGFNEKIVVQYDHPNNKSLSFKIGPPCGLTDNEKVLGVFPHGCSICVSRKDVRQCGPYPEPGKGCHAGTEMEPNPKCQLNFTNQQTDGTVTLMIVPQNTPCAKQP
jgi:hypothetical protein